MKHELNVWVIGGDLRQAKLAELLQGDGHTVHTYALDRSPEPAPGEESNLTGAELADCVVLPLPAAGEGGTLNAPLSGGSHPLTQVLDALRPGQVICAGRVDPATRAMAEERGLTLHDYFAREELAVANAVPAALAVWHRPPPIVFSKRILATPYIPLFAAISFFIVTNHGGKGNPTGASSIVRGRMLSPLSGGKPHAFSAKRIAQRASSPATATPITPTSTSTSGSCAPISATAGKFPV